MNLLPQRRRSPVDYAVSCLAENPFVHACLTPSGVLSIYPDPFLVWCISIFLKGKTRKYAKMQIRTSSEAPGFRGTQVEVLEFILLREAVANHYWLGNLPTENVKVDQHSLGITLRRSDGETQ